MSLEPYWTITHGHANRTGWSCRECHTVIYQGEPIVIRDGRKLRLMYHERYYSGGSDPRTQVGSSYHDKNGQMLNLSKKKRHLPRDMVNRVAVNMVTKVICMQRPQM